MCDREKRKKTWRSNTVWKLASSSPLVHLHIVSMSRRTKGRILGERSGGEAWCRLEEVITAAAFRGDDTSDTPLLFPAASWIWLPACCLWIYEHNIRPLTGFMWEISASGRTRWITVSARLLLILSNCTIRAQVGSGSTERSTHLRLRKHIEILWGARSLALRSDTRSLICPTTCGNGHRSSNLWSINCCSNESDVMKKNSSCSKSVKMQQINKNRLMLQMSGQRTLTWRVL